MFSFILGLKMRATPEPLTVWNADGTAEFKYTIRKNRSALARRDGTGGI
jgi:hypothetical protein